MNDVTKGVTKDITKDGVKDGVKELPDIQEFIIAEIRKSPNITTSELAQKQLQALGVLTREGGRKEGHWVIITD